jgi:hypothetical protein
VRGDNQGKDPENRRGRCIHGVQAREACVEPVSSLELVRSRINQRLRMKIVRRRRNDENQKGDCKYDVFNKSKSGSKMLWKS